MRTLSDLYNEVIIHRDNPKLIQANDFTIVPDWFNFYNSGAIDTDYMYMVTYFGSRVLETPDKWHGLLKASLKRNEYTFKNLYRTIVQDYDPIANYDKTSTITTTKNGAEILTDKGSSDLSYKGTETDTLEKIGSEKDTLTKSGSESMNHSGTESVTNYQSAFDNYGEGSNAVLSNKQVTDWGNTGIEDNTTFSNRKDENEKVFTNRKDENTKTFTDRKDSTVLDMEHKTEFEERYDVVEERTIGNIGITTSAQMLESERLLSMYRFLDSLYSILFDDMCTYEWECDL